MQGSGGYVCICVYTNTHTHTRRERIYIWNISIWNMIHILYGMHIISIPYYSPTYIEYYTCYGNYMI